MKPRLHLLTGHCVDEIDKLEPKSVQCCITSPPYLWLRDYETDPVLWPEITFTPMIGLPPVTVPAQNASLGLEQDILSFLAHIVHVFRSVHRVLRDDGLCWINFGDSYASGGRGGGGSYMDERGDASWKAKSSTNGWRKPPPGFGRKDMLGMPWRVAYALQADGWQLRSDVIWQKPNCMPASVGDLEDLGGVERVDRDTLWRDSSAHLPQRLERSGGPHGQARRGSQSPCRSRRRSAQGPRRTIKDVDGSRLFRSARAGGRIGW